MLYEEDLKTGCMLVQVGRQIRDERGDPVRELAVEPQWDREDHVALLAQETIDAGKSVLIFCASKKVHCHFSSPPSILEIAPYLCSICSTSCSTSVMVIPFKIPV